MIDGPLSGRVALVTGVSRRQGIGLRSRRDSPRLGLTFCWLTIERMMSSSRGVVTTSQRWSVRSLGNDVTPPSESSTLR